MATSFHGKTAMNLFLRLMGHIAQASASSARQSLNMVPGNWVVIGISGFMAAILGQIGLRDHDPLPFLFVVPLSIVSVLFLISTLKRDTFFRIEPASASAPATSSQKELFDTPFGFTGRLRLHEKEAQRFINVPAYATHLESGSLAFVSRIDASTRYSGVVTKSKVGLWLSVPRFESPSIESGTLFYGKTPLPALRLQFSEGADARKPRVKAILTFDTPEHRDAMRAFLLTQVETSSLPVSASPFSPLTT